MLGDKIFYPLAVLVIAGMIALALSFGHSGPSLNEARIVEEGWTLEGENLQRLTVSPGSEAQFVEADGGYIRLSQFTPDGVGPPSIGVFAALDPAYERAFVGKRLRITVRARSSAENGLEQMHTAYFPMEVGAHFSEWKAFNLQPVFRDYTYDYTPPIVDVPPEQDLLAIFPGRAGERRGVDVQSIRVEVLP